MTSQRPKALTYRVENIPFGTTEDQLVRTYFYVKDQEYIKVKSFVPAVDTVDDEEGDYTATILFRPHEPTLEGPRIQDETITVDQDFRGFTPLYVPSRDKWPIVADIIAVTGLAGHAFGSWAHSDEHMWLRDYLPKDAPNARILTYGYHSKLQGSTSMNILQDHTNKFVHSLVDMREESQCESRPIIFIGHSLGCLIIKKALTDAISLGIVSSRLPVREIIFLAAPHRGLNITALQTLVKGEATEQIILELKSESPTLTWLNQSFARFARDIDILTCYENKPTKTAINVDGVWKREGPPVMMVTPDSARQYYPREKLVSADSDHSQIAKIKRGQNGIYPAVKAAIKHGLVSTAKIVAVAGDAQPESSRFQERRFLDLPLNIHQSSALPDSHGGVFDSQAKDSAIRSTSEVRPSPPATLNPVEASSIIVEAALTPVPNIQNAPQAAERSHSSESENPITSNEPFLPPPEASESQQEETVSHETMDIVSKVATPKKEEENDKQSLEDEELEAMEREFNDMVKWRSKGLLISKCTSCANDISISGYHYFCLQCDNAATWICQNCYNRGRSCQTHKVRLIKGEVKPWSPPGQGQRFLDPHVTAEDSELIRAIKENDPVRIRKYAKNRDLLNLQDHTMYKPLHVAARLGLDEPTKLLIECGAELESKSGMGYTPLSTAITANQIGTVKILLNCKANIETKNGEHLWRALHTATVYGMWHIIILLLRNGAEIEATSNSGTPLQLAVRFESSRTVRILLDAGANPNTICKEDGNPPMYYACTIKDHHTAYEIASLLLEYGARPEVRCGQNFTPIMVAASYGHFELCKALVDRRVNLNFENQHGATALFWAAREGYEPIVDLLIASGASCFPPSVLTGKWKNLESRFDSRVNGATKKGY